MRPIIAYIFADRNLDDGAAAGPINNIRNEMIAPTTGHPETVFGRLNSQEGFVTQMCVMEADNAERPTDEMIAPTTAHPATVFGQLNSQEGFVTQVCVMEADNPERPISE